ncbi:adenylate/guanylate cyclase domain-containing protein [Nordella sp. HKS 07]|uniref:adenylate/guanylate cyclase domain-containing protein n=1 Tax=Nordella sp. HKS 07 TaxID=2712222 RepID=UPI0013E150D0|nr:adenylate/guanylate cyclase domain-containing protein [Nordella sp. HKS 07]QIG48597.1 adenylate/guanylate cyclase domain-containing protein [Nordella sp. HKS 07]
MAEEPAQRRLAAILAADVAGYSRLMGANEDRTLAGLKAYRRDLIDPKISEHRGRIVKTTGDGLLVEFASVIDALRCAVEVQRSMAQRNGDVPPEQRIEFRIGLNVGDIIAEADDIYGDGVNVAARLEGLAEPGGICVSGRVQEDARGKVDLAFDDIGEQRLKNIAWPVRVYRVQLGVEEAAVRHTRSLSDKPSIAVLPFTNMSGDAEQEFFADGLTEDIITALSRISGLWVIARTSTFTYKGKPVDVERVARELSVSYVMEGSVRRAGGRLRVTAQLVDATSGRHVWAERYDRALADLFDIQDDITRSIAASTQTQVTLAEGVAAGSRASTNHKAIDLIARAWARCYGQTAEAAAEASSLVEEAIGIDPSNPVAHRVRAAIFFDRIWSEDISPDATNMARAAALARTALRLGPGDEYAHLVMAWAWAYCEGRMEEAIAECERGLEINPSCSILYGNIGAYLAALGRPQEAIEACQLSLKLNPRDPSNFWRHYAIATAHFVAGDYEASLKESKRIARSRLHLPSAIIWAASAAALSETQEVQTAVADCLAQRPNLRTDSVVPGMLRFTREEDHQRLLALLRKAGLPE